MAGADSSQEFRVLAGSSVLLAPLVLAYRPV